MVLPAPGRFSTITPWPQSSWSFGAIIRVGTSTAPPAEYGTISLTGRLGNVCAWAVAHAMAPAPASAIAQTRERVPIAASCARLSHRAVGEIVDVRQPIAGPACASLGR